MMSNGVVVVVVITGSGNVAVGSTVGNVVPGIDVVDTAWRATRYPSTSTAAHMRPNVPVPVGLVPPGHVVTHAAS